MTREFIVSKNLKKQKTYGQMYYQANSKKKKAYSKAYYQVNSEKALAYQRIYRQANPEKIQTCKKIYRQNNPEKIKIYDKTYRQVNNEKMKSRQKDYRQANPDKYRLYNRKRRALKRGVYHEPYMNNYVFERDGWICGICGRKINRRLKHPNPLSSSIDHIIPLSKGGNDDPVNAQAAHLRCNFGKHNRKIGQLRMFA